MVNNSFFRFFFYLRWKTIKKTIFYVFQRRLFGLAAEMAFNNMLALFPAILAVLTALGMFQQSLEDTVSQLTIQYKDVFPDMAWDLLENFIDQITLTQSKSLFSLSFIGAIWVSSSALSTAMNALDEIHQIPRQQRRPFWQAKLISLLITGGTLVLLILASFIILTGDSIVKLSIDLMEKIPITGNQSYLLLIFWQLLSWPIAIGLIVTAIAFIYQMYKLIIEQKKHYFKKATFLLVLVVSGLVVLISIGTSLILLNNLIISLKIDYTITSILLNFWRYSSLPIALVIVSIAFAFIYRIGPSRWIVGMPIFPGAILAAFSWAGVSSLFRLYVSNFAHYNRVYGIVGAVIVLMLWLQISSLVMLIGSQLNFAVAEAMEARKIESLSS